MTRIKLILQEELHIWCNPAKLNENGAVNNKVAKSPVWGIAALRVVRYSVGLLKN